MYIGVTYLYKSRLRQRNEKDRNFSKLSRVSSVVGTENASAIVGCDRGTIFMNQGRFYCALCGSGCTGNIASSLGALF